MGTTSVELTLQESAYVLVLGLIVQHIVALEVYDSREEAAAFREVAATPIADILCAALGLPDERVHFLAGMSNRMPDHLVFGPLLDAAKQFLVKDEEVKNAA